MRRVALSTLNASTLDILNVIRENASYDYQQSVPSVTKYTDIPRVGEVIYGTPALANQFLNALINRIALVRVQSATFNNPYARLKKGYLEFGETIEEIFVNIAQVVDYNPEKASAREFQRTLPQVDSAFHVMNWRVMYPVTIQDEDLKQAFLSIDGVSNLIAKIVDAIYTAAEYDEYLLFKYLLIKNITKGKFYPVGVNVNDIKDCATNFRGYSNALTFMSKKYSELQVRTNTPKERQIIFMDSQFNAKYDVEVLASAFNMDKADFMGRLYLIDDWASFDNERFSTIRANSTGLEEVTKAELDLMHDVKAVLIDENWFQVYDNNNKFTEKYVASGLYWNYFYHTWKTVSSSPFSNAIVFADSTNVTTGELPETITIEVVSKEVSEDSIALGILAHIDEATFNLTNCVFSPNLNQVKSLRGIYKFGSIITPTLTPGGTDNTTGTVSLNGIINNYNYSGTFTGKTYATIAVGDTTTLNKKSVVSFASGDAKLNKEPTTDGLEVS